MSNRNLLILAVVAAVMAVVAVVQSRLAKLREAAMRPVAADTYLIQGLDPARVSAVEIGKGENPLRLERVEDGFVIVGRDGYPADTGRINSLLTSCLDIRIKELITSNPANHESLDVTEENCQSLVRFINSEGEVITGVIIGTSRLPDLQFDRRTTYVRLVSSDDVYLAAEVPVSLDGSPADYMDRELTGVEGADIETVTVSGPDGSYTLRPADPNGGGDVILEEKPEGRTLKQSESRQVLTALTSLSFNDVRKASAEGGGLEFDRTYECRLKDSTVYSLQIAGEGDKTYVKCSADFTDKTPVVKEKRVETDEELKAKEAKLIARQSAEQFNARTGGWVYEIADWKAKNLTTSLEDLLEEVEQDEPEAGEEAAG
jgi:hypothetical protein